MKRGVRMRTEYVDDRGFVEALKAAMAEARMTQAELAEKSGVDKGYVSRVICGKTKPGYAWVMAVATAAELRFEGGRWTNS